MGSTATEIEELDDTTYKYLIGEQTEKMWQRLKGM
jgi:calcium/calmodulin-dependent 3',5'-cyclic nucleotide phosphodiesterase